MPGSVINIPNALSFTRLMLVPVLLLLAYQSLIEPFLYVLGVSLLTDSLDGYFARKLDQISELGARLDSWGDLFTYIAMVFGLAWLWPQIFERETWFLLLALFCYLLPSLTGLLKFRELPSYHTWAAKIAAVLMLPAYYIMVLMDESGLFRLVVIFHIWVAIEEVYITVILNRTRYNVPTLFHAREIMRRQRARMSERRRKRSKRLPGVNSGDDKESTN